jgi:sporulation protein YlmC with PRC-barrel domain
MKRALVICPLLGTLLSFHSLVLAEVGPETSKSKAAESSATAPAPAVATSQDGVPRTEPWSIDLRRLGLLKQTTTLVDKRVKDRNEKAVGKAQNLLLDVVKGQAVAVLVSGSAGHVIPVPARSFAAVIIDQFMMRMDRQVFERAPGFALPNPAVSTLTGVSLQASFRYFGDNRIPQADVAYFSAAALTGMTVRGQDHQVLGQLKDIMVDVPCGRIAYLVVEPAAGKGDLYPVPPITVLNVSADGLVLRTDREHLLAGPHFSSEFWSDLAFPEMATSVCRHYQVPPAHATPIAAVAKPPASSTPPSDQQITQAVLAEIARVAGNSEKPNINVITSKGRVTLNGTVRNEAQKKQVAEAAQRVAGAANVEDHLEIWGKTKTAQL